MSEEITDVKTTPGWLRVPALLLLGSFILYFAVCFATPYSAPLPSWQWPGRWKMFTKPSSSHYGLVAMANVNGDWKAVDLEAMFPYRWGSGPRYARSSFWRSGHRVRVLASAVCGRHPEHPTVVTIVEQKWKVSIGSYEQPKNDLREKIVLKAWPCTRKEPLPQGRRI